MHDDLDVSCHFLEKSRSIPYVSVREKSKSLRGIPFGISLSLTIKHIEQKGNLLCDFSNVTRDCRHRQRRKQLFGMFRFKSID